MTYIAFVVICFQGMLQISVFKVKDKAFEEMDARNCYFSVTFSLKNDIHFTS